MPVDIPAARPTDEADADDDRDRDDREPSPSVVFAPDGNDDTPLGDTDQHSDA